MMSSNLSLQGQYNPSSHMERGVKIIRNSIHTLLKNYEDFSSTTLVLLPFSASILFSQALFQFLPTIRSIHGQFSFLFHFSQFVSNLGILSNIKSSSFSLYILFLFTCFVISLPLLVKAKSFIIHVLKQNTPISSSSSSSSLKPLLRMQIFNLVLHTLFSMAAFKVLAFMYEPYKLAIGSGSGSEYTLFGLIWGSVNYFITINISVICNLAFIIMARAESRVGVYAAIREAFRIRRREPISIVLAVPTNIGFIAVEALFRYRIMRNYQSPGWCCIGVVSEGVLISYMYSLLIVIDMIVSCLFIESDRSKSRIDVAGSGFKLIIEDQQ